MLPAPKPQYGPCLGCGKTTRNNHCKACQDSKPVVWEEARETVCYGRFRGKTILLRRYRHEWTGFMDGEDCIGTMGSLERAKEIFEEWLLQDRRPAIYVV